MSSKIKALVIGLMVVMLSSCANYGETKPDLLRSVASEELSKGKVDDAMMQACVGNLEAELDPVTIVNKFKVELVRDVNYAVEEEARALCIAKVASFGECNYGHVYVEKNGAFSKKYKVTSNPEVNEGFLKKYRKHLICNRVAACELKASLNDNVSANTLDRIHRVYENNQCDSIGINVVENKIVQESNKSDEDELSNSHTRKKKTQEREKESQDRRVPNVPAREPVVAKDPSAQFCQLRSSRTKCEELGGVCEWVAPSSGYCKARVGSTDPNARFCQIRSPKSKCEELSGVCEWSEATTGFCKAR